MLFFAIPGSPSRFDQPSGGGFPRLALASSRFDPHNLELIVSRAHVPVIVDAGLGTASDVALAFELGCAAVLLNTAVAKARRPVQMARAVCAAAIAGREAYLAGRMPPKSYAEASSPLIGRAWTSQN